MSGREIGAASHRGPQRLALQDGDGHDERPPQREKNAWNDQQEVSEPGDERDGHDDERDLQRPPLDRRKRLADRDWPIQVDVRYGNDRGRLRHGQDRDSHPELEHQQQHSQEQARRERQGRELQRQDDQLGQRDDAGKHQKVPAVEEEGPVQQLAERHGPKRGRHRSSTGLNYEPGKNDGSGRSRIVCRPGAASITCWIELTTMDAVATSP